MKRLLLIGFGLLLAAACGPAPAEPPVTRPPDLLLVVVDTLRADHLSAYGYHRPTSPRLDAHAARGALFTDVTAQSSWTLPSMTSLLTGRLMFENARRLPSAVPSLAERLRDTGYETAAFVGNPNLTRSSGFARGFDHYITRDDTGGTTWDAPDLEAAVESWLATHPPGDKPRFVYLHYLDPHWPYAPAEDVSLDGVATLRDDTIRAWMGWLDGLADGEHVRQQFNRDRLSILADVDAYDHEIAVVDGSIDRLLALLGSREHLFVLAADHGEGLWDHRHHPKVVLDELAREGRDAADLTLRDAFFRDHSYHMYQELIATPLIAVGPGLPGGARIDTPALNVDIAPTLLRAAGLPDDPGLDGLPLQDLASGAARHTFAYSHAKEATVVRRLSDSLKLIFPTSTGDWYEMPTMVFDLVTDPHERRNLAAGRDQVGGAAVSLDDLKVLIRERERMAAAFDLFDGEDPEKVDDAVLKAMRELGYVGAGFATGEDDDAGR